MKIWDLPPHSAKTNIVFLFSIIVTGLALYVGLGSKLGVAGITFAIGGILTWFGFELVKRLFGKRK